MSAEVHAMIGVDDQKTSTIKILMASADLLL